MPITPRAFLPRRQFGLNSLDFIGVLYLVLVSIPAAWLSPHTLTFVGAPRPADDSWIIDTVYKAVRGVWIGRDVAFTYGPFYQWLSSLPSRLEGFSLGTAYATYGIVPAWCTFLLTWLALRLLIPEQPAWKRCLLLLLLTVFWSPLDIRMFVGIALYAIFLSTTYACAEERVNAVLQGSAASVLCVLGFLISADTGVAGLIALLLCYLSVAFESRRHRQALRRVMLALLASLAAFLVAATVVNSFMGRPFDYHFWKTSFAIVSGYRWFEPSMMGKSGKLRLLATLACGIIVFAIRSLRRAPDTNVTTGRPAFLISGFTFAFACMQTGLVRSDMGHIVIGTFPMIFFIGCIAFGFQNLLQWAAVSASILASLVLASPNRLFFPSDFLARLSQVQRPLTTCPVGFRAYDRACIAAPFAATLDAAAPYLNQGTSEHDAVVVFPYQSIYGVAARRDVGGGLLLTYLADGLYLSDVELSGLIDVNAPLGLYLPEGELSPPIDGVPNFTRTPQVWFWLLQHYRSDKELTPGIWGLKRDDSLAQRIRLSSVGLGLSTGQFPITKRHATVELGRPAEPVGGFDFVHLRLNVKYPFWWRFRKPQHLQLEITREDGERALKSFVVPPNMPSDVWFFPWDEPELVRYFDPDQTKWRNKRSSITSLRLLITPHDWISTVPDSVTVTQADGVVITRNPLPEHPGVISQLF